RPLASLFFVMLRPLPSSTLFPYTTLFRSHLLDIHDIWVFPQHQLVCFPLREHIGCLHIEPPLSDQPPCLCFFSTAAVSIGCAIYFSFPGWGNLQAAVDRVKIGRAHV